MLYYALNLAGVPVQISWVSFAVGILMLVNNRIWSLPDALRALSMIAMGLT